MAGGASPTDPRASATPLAARQSRWLGQQYADITKLREHAPHGTDRAATPGPAARLPAQHRIEKLRHQATLLREKGQRRARRGA